MFVETNISRTIGIFTAASCYRDSSQNSPHEDLWPLLLQRQKGSIQWNRLHFFVILSQSAFMRMVFQNEKFCLESSGKSQNGVKTKKVLRLKFQVTCTLTCTAPKTRRTSAFGWCVMTGRLSPQQNWFSWLHILSHVALLLVIFQFYSLTPHPPSKEETSCSDSALPFSLLIVGGTQSMSKIQQTPFLAYSSYCYFSCYNSYSGIWP